MLIFLFQVDTTHMSYPGRHVGPSDTVKVHPGRVISGDRLGVGKEEDVVDFSEGFSPPPSADHIHAAILKVQQDRLTIEYSSGFTFQCQGSCILVGKKPCSLVPFLPILKASAFPIPPKSTI